MEKTKCFILDINRIASEYDDTPLEKTGCFILNINRIEPEHDNEKRDYSAKAPERELTEKPEEDK